MEPPPFFPRRFTDPADTRQVGRQRLVYSEKDLRVAIAQAVAENLTQTGRQIVIAESFLVTAPIVLPADAPGLVITSHGYAPLYAGAALSAFFVLKGAAQVLDRIHARATSTYAVDTFVDLDGTAQPGCIVRDCIAFTSALATGDLIDGALVGNTWVGSGVPADSAITLRALRSVIQGNRGTGLSIELLADSTHNSILGNNVAGGDVDTSAGDGGTILGATTDPGTKTLHADDIDLDACTSTGPASSVEDETTWGITPAVGTSTKFAREDHTHGTPDEPAGSGGRAVGTATLSSDNTVVNVSALQPLGLLRISSDTGTPGARTFTLSDPDQGDDLVVAFVDTGAGAELVNTGNVRLTGNWNPLNQPCLLHLVGVTVNGVGTVWAEIARSAL